MTRFHLMHCIPPKLRAHGLHGYLEVIQTITWGLQQLGHEVSYGLNQYHTDAINIVFGAQVLPLEVLQGLPDTTIVYNMEQLRNLSLEQIRPELHLAAQRFQIWDYSSANIDAWNLLGARRAAVVPVGYAPVLTRIPKPVNQDIEVLLYGLTGTRRVNAFHAVSGAGFTALFVSGLYGPARDELIARSKLILNATLYEDSRQFEIVRVSYLLANRKAVVSIAEGDIQVEADIAGAVRFSTLERLVTDCAELLDRSDLRNALETKGFDVMSRRDIRVILRNVMAR